MTKKRSKRTKMDQQLTWFDSRLSQDNVHLFDRPDAVERMLTPSPVDLHYAATQRYALFQEVRTQAFSVEEREAAWKLMSVVGAAIEGDADARAMMLRLLTVINGTPDEIVRKAVGYVEREMDRWNTETPPKSFKAEILVVDLSRVDERFGKLKVDQVIHLFDRLRNNASAEHTLAVLANEVKALGCNGQSVSGDAARFRKALDRCADKSD